jgi:endonuclease YncB( thermonuclease family)
LLYELRCIPRCFCVRLEGPRNNEAYIEANNNSTIHSHHSLFADSGQQKTITVKVVGVSDGDTITVLAGLKHQHKVRLEGIDAPESAQAFCTQAPVIYACSAAEGAERVIKQ